MHTKANISLQRQDYQAAEDGFQKAVAFFHKYFPNESAGDDLQELMKIANHRKDQKAGLKYARQILAEPNVAPIHKGRALFRISQFAFNKNNKELYDSRRFSLPYSPSSNFCSSFMRSLFICT